MVNLLFAVWYVVGAGLVLRFLLLEEAAPRFTPTWWLAIFTLVVAVPVGLAVEYVDWKRRRR